MAARKWTDAQKAAQSAKIHGWQPWQHSTGAKSATGKVIVSRNAYQGGSRPLCRFTRWIYWAINHPETLTPEKVEAAQIKSVELFSGNAEYRAASITKLITKYGHCFSETELTDLQELVKLQEDFKKSLMQ